MNTRIKRFELQHGYIKGYFSAEEKEYEGISIPITSGTNDTNVITLPTEALTDLVDIVNYSLKGTDEIELYKRINEMQKR